MRKLSRAGVVMLGVLLIGNIGEGLAQVPTLKVAAFTPVRSNTTSKIMMPWVERVQAEAGDSLNLQTFWGGALGRNPVKQLKMVLDGVADVALISTDYTRGRFPEMSAFNLPYLVNSATEASEAQWRLYAAGKLRGFDGVTVLSSYATAWITIHVNRPVADLADLKGLKIRAAGFGPQGVVKAADGTPVFTPITKATEALARGVMDGIMVNLGGYRSFRLDGVTSHHLHANFGVTPLTVVMSDASLAKLPPKARAAIEKHSGAVFTRAAAAVMDEIDASLAKSIDSDPKHTIVRPTPEQNARWKAMLMPLHAEWQKRFPEAPAFYAELERVLADIRAGK